MYNLIAVMFFNNGNKKKKKRNNNNSPDSLCCLYAGSIKCRSWLAWVKATSAGLKLVDALTTIYLLLSNPSYYIARDIIKYNQIALVC